MTPQARTQNVKSRSRKRATGSSSGKWAWWPLIVGIAITPLTVKTAEILPLMGPGGLLTLRLLYPFAMLLREHALGLSESLRESLSHVMLYAQFPLYGVYAMVAMRWKSRLAAIVQLAAIHLLSFGVVWLLTQM
jgi:hypothetical protein